MWMDIQSDKLDFLEKSHTDFFSKLHQIKALIMTNKIMQFSFCVHLLNLMTSAVRVVRAIGVHYEPMIVQWFETGHLIRKTGGIYQFFCPVDSLNSKCDFSIVLKVLVS